MDITNTNNTTTNTINMDVHLSYEDSDTNNNNNTDTKNNTNTINMDDDHLSYEDSNIRQLCLHPCAQHILHIIRIPLIDEPYLLYGMTNESTDRYTVVMPGDFKSDRRKPITELFQKYCDVIVEPIIMTMIFGKFGWNEIKKHILTLKVNTINISENAPYYNCKEYHMHLDGNIGIPDDKNHMQEQMIRLLFSIVPDSYDIINGKFYMKSNNQYDSTVYLTRQPTKGFPHQKAFHEYMSSRYNFTLNVGRPIYQIPNEDIRRSPPGEVNIHLTHPATAIHAEPNPCPTNRCLFVFDLKNIVTLTYKTLSKNNKNKNKNKITGVLPRIDIPIKRIVELMKVLEDPNTEEFKNRLAEVNEVIIELSQKGSEYEGCQIALEKVLIEINNILKNLL